MPKFLIRRDIPNAGAMSADELRGASQKSCHTLQSLGPSIQWVQSYVTGDTIHCVYIADNEQLIRDHAEQAGFPANQIMEIKTIMDPTTAEAPTPAAV